MEMKEGQMWGWSVSFMYITIWNIENWTGVTSKTELYVYLPIIIRKEQLINQSFH